MAGRQFQDDKRGKGPIFVIQKHAASHLHFDFRLEIDGVLTSWAVPKGIPTNPAEKHLAIMTEDHPLDYAKFEGVIPEDNYGAGTVMVWDIGTYRNIKESDGKLVPMDQCLKRGTVEVWLEGEKLHGGYALIRTKLGGGDKNWLLLKMKDEYAKTAIPNATKSALTGRTMTQIAKDEKANGWIQIASKEPRSNPSTSSLLRPSGFEGQAGRALSRSNSKESENNVKFGKHSVTLTNQEKVLFPDDGITKGDLINYYTRIAPHMLPYMKDRAVTMHRFPDGIQHESFYQKNIADYFPDWIKSIKISKQDGGNNNYVVCNDVETLVYLANQACITPHIWLSRIDKLNYPDRMIFDLDPGKDNAFVVVRRAAFAIRDILTKLNLTSFVMTTGSRGVHIVIPLNRQADFDTVRAFAHDVATVIATQNPKDFTVEQRINKRKGRLFIDTTRNAFAQTGVAPYAVRAKPGAPVATPLSWDELENSRLTAHTYTIKNIFKHLQAKGNPWKDMGRSKQSLTKARKILDGLMKQTEST